MTQPDIHVHVVHVYIIYVQVYIHNTRIMKCANDHANDQLVECQTGTLGSKFLLHALLLLPAPFSVSQLYIHVVHIHVHVYM